MKIVAVALMLLSFGASACEVDGSKMEAERDLRYQEVLIDVAAVKADLVATAIVARIGKTRRVEGQELTQVEFKVLSWLKQDVVPEEAEPLKLYGELSLVHVACLPSDQFYANRVQVGESVVIYGRDGRILRAAGEKRASGEISYGREVELLEVALGPN